jgi:glycosyltransferase involved in cell wall biosynthesis
MKYSYSNTLAVFMITTGNWKEGTLPPPTFVKCQAESLQATGCEVFLSILDDRTSLSGILRNLERIKSEMARYRPTLVHAQYGSIAAGIGNLVKGSCPLIVSFCGDDLLGTPAPGLVWRAREKFSQIIGLWAARRAAAVIVKSRNLFLALPTDVQRRATILPNGVDTKMFRPLDQSDCRDELGWDAKSKIVLFDGSWNGQNEDHHRKNPRLARAVVDLLSRKGHPISLQMLSNMAHDTVPLMMNAADCLLVTSLQEGSPNIVKEAMACNLPIVSVSCGDVAERLSDTRPGATCSYNPIEIADALHEVLLDGRRSNGRERLIAQGLTTESVAEQLLDIYGRVSGYSARTQQQHKDPCAV